MDITLIQGAVTGLKTAYDIVVGMNKLNTLEQVQTKSIELGQIIIAAQTSVFNAYAAQSAMVEEIRTLKEEIVRVKAWESQKQRYKLTNPWSEYTAGSIAYALKESMKESDPPHLICTKCYEDGRKSILNPLTHTGNFVVYTCPVCKLQIPTGSRWTVPPIEYASD